VSAGSFSGGPATCAASIVSGEVATVNRLYPLPKLAEHLRHPRLADPELFRRLPL
jgi:hypothetical protein